MNPDILKIRQSRFFTKLPERAFDRILPQLKVRHFERAELILDYSKKTEFSACLGYVVSGRVLFMSAKESPLGLALKDEFFLGRPFTLGDQSVHSVISGVHSTLVVYIPKSIVQVLAEASESLADVVDEIYTTVFERSQLILSDKKSAAEIESWLKGESDKTLVSWVGAIEAKRFQAIEKKRKEKQRRKWLSLVWAAGIFLAAFLSYESWVRWKGGGVSLWTFIDPESLLSPFQPKSDFNIGLGIVGFSLVVLTNAHTLVKVGIRKWKWRVNFQFSQQLHMMFGVIGSYLLILHTAGSVNGINVAHWAFYTILLVLFSGFVGQFISSLIPKTLQGERMKLESIKDERKGLRDKAQIMMESDHQYKTALATLSEGLPQSFWANIFQAPLLWMKRRRIIGDLAASGLGDKGASLAAELLTQEFRLAQSIRFLEVSNLFFKRWMVIHKPCGYLAYVLGVIHIILAMFLG